MAGSSGVLDILRFALKYQMWKFGIIADIQYADIDDGESFMGVKRYYRHALQAATLAVEEWEQQGDDVLFVAQLGDIIDGFNKFIDLPRSEACPKLFACDLGELDGDGIADWQSIVDGNNVGTSKKGGCGPADGD